MIQGKQFAEKLYSENQEERLYSTGNDELDNLLEKAFCEGYELAQREYSLKDELKKAIKEGDEEKIKKLEKRVIRRGTVAGVITGGGSAGVGASLLLKNNKYLKDNQLLKSPEFKDLKNHITGSYAFGGALIGGSVKNATTRHKFNKILKKAEEEVKEENKDQKNKK